jgi:hypothetical protein
MKCTSAAAMLAISALALGATACSSGNDRSAGRYCTAVGDHLGELNSPALATQADIDAMLAKMEYDNLEGEALDAVAMCDEDKLTFLEKRFCEAFNDMQDSRDVRVAVPQIANRGTTPLPRVIKALPR